jgi:hypothetical protein
MNDQTTSEETTELESNLPPNLIPFQDNDPRTVESGRVGGSKSTPKKRIAARIRELKKKYPLGQEMIADLIDVLMNLDIFAAFTESELIELLLLKNEAISQAATAEERYKIQRDYLTVVLQVGATFYGKEQINKQKEELTSQSLTVDQAVKVVEEARKQGRLNIPPEWFIEVLSATMDNRKGKTGFENGMNKEVVSHSG